MLSSISCKRKYGHPCSFPPAAACCGLFYSSALSLSSSFSAAVASIVLRLGMVRDEPKIPRTHQTDAACGTATLSNYSAIRFLEILACVIEAARYVSLLVPPSVRTLRPCQSRHIYLGATPSGIPPKGCRAKGCRAKGCPNQRLPNQGCQTELWP